MTVSRASLLLVGLAAVAMTTAAVAEPVQLIPRQGATGQPLGQPLQPSMPSSGTQTEPRTGTMPFRETAEPVLRSDGRSNGRSDGKVEVTSLGAIDPSSVGLLESGAGGFGLDMWAGSGRALVEGLMARLPAPLHTPARQDLLRRLLLSTAKVPAGPAVAKSFLGVRAERLAAAGYVGLAAKLADLAPQFLDDPALIAVRVDAMWLSGDNAGACDMARAMIRRDSSDEWLKQVTFCRALEGEHAAAAMAVNMLREQGDVDPAFETLMAALAGDDTARLTDLRSPRALDVAMMRAARQPLPESALATAGAALLGTLTSYPGLSLDKRLAAAARAARLGVISPTVLRQIYGAVLFSPEELVNAASVIETERGPRADALLYQVAQSQNVPVARAEALRLALKLGRDTDRYFVAVQANAPAIKELQPASELLFAGEEIGRALLVLGQPEKALSWYDIVRQGATVGDPEAQRAALGLWALLQVGDASGAVPAEPDFLGRWREAQAAVAPDNAAERVVTLYSLMSALGATIPNSEWVTTLDAPFEGGGLPPATVFGLRNAIAAGRVGESVLWSLIAMGSGERRTDISTVVAVVEALDRLGLRNEARRIALESAVRRGL